MAYTKTVWQTGDVITAEKLNNMEGGIEGSCPVIIEAVGEYIENDTILEYTTDLTNEEFQNLLLSGIPVTIKCVVEGETDFYASVIAFRPTPNYSEAAPTFVFYEQFAGDWISLQGANTGADESFVFDVPMT